jgi:hypothetical protein
VLVPTNVIDHTGSISNLYLMLTLMTLTPGACGNERPGTTEHIGRVSKQREYKDGH